MKFQPNMWIAFVDDDGVEVDKVEAVFGYGICGGQHGKAEIQMVVAFDDEESDETLKLCPACLVASRELRLTWNVITVPMI